MLNFATTRLRIWSWITRSGIAAVLLALPLGCVGPRGDKKGQTERDRERDEALVLNAQLKSLLEAPAVARNVPNTPIKLPQHLDQSTGASGINVRNAFDRRTVAVSNTAPNPKPPVHVLPDTGINSAAYVSAPTVPTTGGNIPLTPPPSKAQPPIQLASSTQPVQALQTGPAKVEPQPPVQIVGTTTEASVQTPAPVTTVVVVQPSEPAAQTPKPVEPQTSIVVASPPATAATSELPKPAANPPTPAVDATKPAIVPGQLVPLVSPTESRPSGFGK